MKQHHVVMETENRQTNYYGINSFFAVYDDRLVDFMLNVNGKYKIKDGVTKYLLRKAMREFFLMTQSTKN